MIILTSKWRDFQQLWIAHPDVPLDLPSCFLSYTTQAIIHEYGRYLDVEGASAGRYRKTKDIVSPKWVWDSILAGRPLSLSAYEVL